MQKDSIRILLVDDDSIDADLTQRALAQITEPQFMIYGAPTLAAATEQLTSGQFDVALLDLGLPDSQRNETLARFRAASLGNLPIVVLTGLADDELALDALSCGAQDYLFKDEMIPAQLSRSIRFAMQRHQLLDQMKAAHLLLEANNRRLTELCKTAHNFVDNVSHEFRTPLTVIREFTSIVRDGLDGPVTAKQTEHLDKVLNRADDLALMIDDMLDISRLESGLLGVWRRPCYVAEMIDNVLGMLKGRMASKQITIDVDIPHPLPLVFCDEEKARRVITNLAVNAIKFTPERGHIRVWAKENVNESEVIIGVTDTGPGISPENLESIFQRFQQAHAGIQSETKGFGLGLNIAIELVNLSMGEMRVESQLGAGSTFTFTLPKHEPPLILDRFLARVSQTVDDFTEITLIIVRSNETAGARPLTIVDEFLQRSIRAQDLVVPYQDGAWIIAAICPQQAFGDLVERLAKQWQDYIRNSPLEKLADLSFEHLGTWDVQRQREEIMHAWHSSAQGHPQESSPRRVLVIDDDPEVSQCLGVRLRASGYETLFAFDGEAGATMAVDCHPDAIVLDNRMPKKDGMTVIRELRMQPATKDIPIVMLSASTRDQNRALEAGASYFVPKPYEAKDVLSAIELSLREEAINDSENSITRR